MLHNSTSLPNLKYFYVCFLRKDTENNTVINIRLR